MLFATPAFHVRELERADIALLQALYDANPEYFLAVNRRHAGPDEAREAFDAVPPPHIGFHRRWHAGVFDEQRALAGVVDVLSDMCAPGVWHIGLFLMATRLHGGGAAAEVYDALEHWIRRAGARWLRLGVVAGNARAERFWERRGFEDVRMRALDTGGKVNDVRVLVKPLSGEPLSAYLALVPRDRPESTLP